MAARHAGAELDQRQGLGRGGHRHPVVPVVPGGKGKATDTLGGINGWLVSKSAPPEAVDFLKFFSQEKYAKEAAAKAAYIPVVKGAESAFTDPLFKRLADDLAKTTYHQNYFDQDLGPLGRPRHQRRIGLRRGGRNDAGGRRRGDPGSGGAAVALRPMDRDAFRPRLSRGGAFASVGGEGRFVRGAARPTLMSSPPAGRTLNGWATIAVFLPPALLLFTVFVALPMAEAAWYGFYNWDGYGRPEKFIGLKNYGYLIGNATFARSLINNGLIIAVSLLVQLPLALGVALMVAGRIPGAAWFRMIFFLPYVLADVAAGLIWHFMFDGDYGLAGAITGALGIAPYFLLADKTWAFSAVLIVIVWKYFGFHMMLYVAGLQGIDRSLLEAAEMDGASAWQRFWHITLPLLGPMIRPVDLLLRRRRAAALRHHRASDRRRSVRDHQHDGVLPLLFRHHPDARRFRLGRRRRAVPHLRDLRIRLPTDLHAR